MKYIIGIVLVALLIGALTVYLILMLNAHEMVYCGDITNEDGKAASVTRVYTTDFSANETLAEIVAAVNAAEGETVTVTEITEILAEYQSIVYAPVFLVNSEQILLHLRSREAFITVLMTRAIQSRMTTYMKTCALTL